MSKKTSKPQRKLSPLSPVARGYVTLNGGIRLAESEEDKLRLRLGDIVLVQRDIQARPIQSKRSALRRAAAEFRSVMRGSDVSLDNLLTNMPSVRSQVVKEASSPDVSQD